MNPQNPAFESMSDEELVDQIRNDRNEAFNVLYHRYAKLASAVAQVAAGSADNRNVVRESFAQIYIKIKTGQFQPTEGMVATWIAAITANTAARQRGQTRRTIALNEHNLERLVGGDPCLSEAWNSLLPTEQASMIQILSQTDPWGGGDDGARAIEHFEAAYRECRNR